MKNLKIKVKENPTLIVDVHSLIYAISASQDIKINLQMPFFRTRVCFPVAPEWDCLIPQKWPHPNIHKNELPFPWVGCEGVSSLKGAMDLAGAAGRALFRRRGLDRRPPAGARRQLVERHLGAAAREDGQRREEPVRKKGRERGKRGGFFVQKR